MYITKHKKHTVQFLFFLFLLKKFCDEIKEAESLKPKQVQGPQVGGRNTSSIKLLHEKKFMAIILFMN